MLFYDNTDEDLKAIYGQLKERYPLILTNTFALDDGFTVDCPILVGKAHGQIIQLYLDCEVFVLDVMDEERTKGTHWHPNDVDQAVYYITEFMEGRDDYPLTPFPQPL